ncbi:MAG TPA: HAD-IB family hydrolase [Polyangiaceae bacterium]|nr:HAD-IB family hydrolase [Polyangiaceae bacterium]
MSAAALFDMDRTLVREATVGLYVRYLRARGGARWCDSARVLWWLAQYTLGVVDAPRVVARALASLEGMHETVLSARCDDWFRRDVERHVSDAGRRAVAAHRARGDVVAIVTGASPYFARPLARRLDIEHVVATELEVGADGRFTGRLSEPLCYGRGKLARTRALAGRLGFRVDESTFYSDSYTDLPLLEAVRTAVAVNPDPRLAAVARRRGWRVERW